VNNNNNHIGLYFCSGCNIGDSLDINDLSLLASKELLVDCTKSHDFLCSEEGVNLIKNDITEKNLKNLVICACSSRQKTEQFSFDTDLVVERVNFREQIVWSHEPNNEDTQMMAEDYIRMAIAKVNMISLPVPYIAENLSSDILIIGAGITGIISAIEGAKAGYNIIVVEKEKEPGGWAKKLYKQIPLHSPYQDPEEPLIHKYIEEIQKLPNVILFTSSTIKQISGQPGLFNILLSVQGKEKQLFAGSIILASGWKPYDPSKLTEYGYGKFKNIITNIELEEMAKSRKIVRPSDEKEVNSILFVQCAGSRDKNHLPYCSNFCCSTTLKQAKYVRDLNKSSSVYIVYKDIRTPGFYEYFYNSVQSEEGIYLTKGEIKSFKGNNGKLEIDITHTLFNEDIRIEVDMMVLATGMTPSNSELLELDYRLGKGLPTLKYDFPDSHFICFPYETRRTGIYAAGTVRAPMDISDCIDDARGATLKAIQCIESVKRGKSLHPRSGDQSYPELYLNRCTDCKRCTEECPFGSYDETETGRPLPNPNRCRRCGICLGACPERIINFPDFSINSISGMIKANSIPDLDQKKPRVLVFVCENDAYPAIDMAGFNKIRYSPFVRFIPVRCIGTINNVWITDALSHGFDGILQIGCKPGENYQCHFIEGSELTERRGEIFSETLDRMMLEPDRIRTEFVEINEYQRIPEIIDNYIKVIETIGPNPFKHI